MSKFRIVGQKLLKGEIEVYGAKNAAMKMIAAACLAPGKYVLNNVPDILDVKNLSEILIEMGAVITRENHTLNIDTTNLRSQDPNPKLVGAIRASVVLIGPLLARFGKISLPHPGGDKIGARPIDRHLKAFEALGVLTKETKTGYELSFAEATENKTGFEEITWTGTENLLIFCSGLPQTTTIENIALEPEVFNLIEMLEKMGAKISVTNRTATVTGSKNLHPTEATCISDRLEAATFAVMAAIIGDGINIVNCPCDMLEALLLKFTQMGIPFAKSENSLYIEKPTKIRAADIVTAEYPGYVTDTQPPTGLLLTQAEGTSTIIENVFESRLGYLKELQKMGAKIELISGKEARITGPTKLHGAHLQSLDLRAGATILLAGLIAEGETIIDGAETIDRGYEKIEERLQGLGAEIKRIP